MALSQILEAARSASGSLLVAKVHQPGDKTLTSACNHQMNSIETVSGMSLPI